jgi:cellobiose phosphorylase
MNPAELKRRGSRGLRAREEHPLELPRQVVELSNGRYRVQLSGVGTGVSEFGGLAVSRWVPDPTCDADGFHIYLRDLDFGAIWSAGFQPTRATPDEYEFGLSPGCAEIRRVDNGIECKTTVCVDPDTDLELRVCRLNNLDDRPRRIELTSYVEFVLTRREADESHPTFSKLFVETEFWAARQAILARRRPRSATESEQWACHRLMTDSNGQDHDDVQFETNRGRFLGRGRTLARPRALDSGAQLTSDWGAVLDPIGSLRTSIALEPGATRSVAFVLGAARSRHEIEAIASKLADLGHAEAIFRAAAQASAATNGADGHTSDGEASPRRIIIHSAHATPESPPSLTSDPKYRPATDGKVRGRSTTKPLQFENGFGGFSADGREYIIRLRPDGRGGHHLPPRPWVNVIANEHAGFLVSERGAGYTWAGNSRENRLTAWHNDPISDPHSEAFWLRDEQSKTFWSLTPGPTPAVAPYEVRHGFGYTTFFSSVSSVEHELTFFMAPDDPVKLVHVQLVNRGRASRRLSLFSYLRWNLGSLVTDASRSVSTEYDSASRAILARNPNRKQFGDQVAFSSVALNSVTAAAELTYSADREAFLGQLGSQESPTAIVIGDQLDKRVGTGLDACAAWQSSFELSPGESFECTFLLGETSDRNRAIELIGKCQSTGAPKRLLEQSKSFWHETLTAVQVETPEPEIDLLVNGWLSYQNLSCRMWGRSAFYQPGGAFGFRDQLQDSAALLCHRPDLTRKQILIHAAQQFADGDVLHFWHPGSNTGLRTRFSDDLLWLPYVVATYIRATGDKTILNEQAPFVRGAALAPGQQEAYIEVEPTASSATIYEHCCLALDRGLTTGQHGLPLIGCGDWNDGMNRVGGQGRGESVWLGFFIAAVLESIIPICTEQGDHERAKRYAAYRSQLVSALESSGWDGDWYRRAYYDDGEPLGSASSDECQIDTIAQAWAVLSGVAPPERAEASIAAVEQHLVDESAGLIRLLTPPFDKTAHDPGYIKGYLPGIRENGGQYTHGVLWYIRALAELGRGSRAVELLKMLSPVSHTADSTSVATYQTEPYVVAADVYGAHPHLGRGGWTWYTGSAGWMFRVAVESIFGFSVVDGRWLVINPSISVVWPSCRLVYCVPGGQTRYEIQIANPKGKQHGVTAVSLDGEPLIPVDGAAKVPLLRDNQRHKIVVRL